MEAHVFGGEEWLELEFADGGEEDAAAAGGAVGSVICADSESSRVELG
jgi:hypothetical protein